MGIKGFVSLNKPLDMTSSDAVVIVRGVLRRALGGEKPKVGHLGTLDPEATGVLPIAVGSATKLFDFAQKKEKSYIADFTFGVETDTLDRAGKIVRTDDKIPDRSEILKVLPQFTGDISQLPPQYSAKSVNGIRAYDLAREGKTVELTPKTVSVFSFDLVDNEKNPHGVFSFKIRCGSGTYIRSLARDLAEKLGTCAYMSSLCRTKSGEFELANSVDLETFKQNPLGCVLPVDTMLKSLEPFELPSESAEKFLNGVKVELDLPEGQFKVYNGGEFLGLGENIEGRLKLIRL